MQQDESEVSDRELIGAVEAYENTAAFPIPRGQGPNVPQFFAPPPLRTPIRLDLERPNSMW